MQTFKGSARTPVLISIVLSLVAYVQFLPVDAARLNELTFEKPFERISASGERQLGSHWIVGGDTTVHRYFARLTPERRAKVGYIWSKRQLETREFAIVLNFRISGQGESFFGNGLALWLTDSPLYKSEDNHGFLGQYKGFGVVFDTFVNPEDKGGDKDVTYFENDGTKAVEDLLDSPKEGCMVQGLRHHENHARFSASQSYARAKIQYKDEYIVISMDPQADGKWVQCYSRQVKIEAGWTENAYIVLTASTGSLTDNHDVLSLTTYDDASDSIQEAADKRLRASRTPQEEKDESALTEDKRVVDDLTARMVAVKNTYNQLLEDFEHQLSALQESTEKTVAKLKDQEADDEKRIAQLEEWSDNRVVDRVKASVSSIKGQMEDQLQKTFDASASRGYGWVMPFFVLMLGLGGMIAFGYKKYQDLRKSHFL